MMTKAPKQHREPETHQQAAPPDPGPLPQGREMPPSEVQPLDAQSDTNMQAIIAAQLTTIQAQFTEATYLFGELPGPTVVPPATLPLQSISDTLAGMQRALGAFISQSNVLMTVWPGPYTAATGVSGNGGSP